jgi:KDO2-lipid IV(A) lauroyltransferase
MIKYWAFRLAAAMVPLVPLRLAEWVAQAAGLALWALRPGLRDRVEANLRHVPSLARDPEQRRWAVRGVFRHLALNYVDFFRIHRLTAATILAGWTIQGQDVFDAAVARGRGVIVLTAHLGNFEFAAARMAAMGYPMLIPAERLKPEPLFQLVARLRSHHGVRFVPVDSTQTLREMFAALREGQLVILAADRDVLGTGVTAPFFGAPARLPTGPVLLAHRSGAAVIGAFTWREGRGRAGGIIVPLDLAGSGAGDPADAVSPESATAGAAVPDDQRHRRTAVVVRALEPVVRMLEEQIAAHPQQWVAALAPIWGEAAGASGGGAM